MNKYQHEAEPERNSELYKAILSLRTVDECIRFFDDLCSISEIRAIEQRYEVARLLYDGHIYNSILEKTSASSATISRVNRSLRYGAGGYRIALDRLKEEEKSENDEGR